MAQDLWKIEIKTPENVVSIFMDGLEEIADSMTSFEDEANENYWYIVIYTQTKPSDLELSFRLEILANISDISCPEYNISNVEEQNWVAESQKNFAPIKAGKFYVHPHWHKESNDKDIVNIKIDPQQAFGTGGHETTFGCLEAIDNLFEALPNPPENILDLGSGTGVLAIAAKKQWPESEIIATDIDPIAVKICSDNSNLNNCDILTIESEGYENIILDNKKFDLIIANILAIPLIEIAEESSKHTKKSGLIILSGLLSRQREEVVSAYQEQNFVLKQEFINNQWPTLIFEKL